MRHFMIIGRLKEQKVIASCLESPRAEFLAVYGRRRVGKTFLIREYFGNSFAFYATGVANSKMKDQLRAFSDSLREYGAAKDVRPRDWFDAFSMLKTLLSAEKVKRDPVSGKIIVFLDELPWMDTARSDFKSALDYFWNSWASARADVVLIVCGSATSWIIDHLISDKGGFYNRVTRKIHLQPFTLLECEALFRLNGVQMNRRQVMESYMVFGGIPYYLNCFDRRLSLAQNIDELCFQPGGQLYDEYDRLFRSLFKNPGKHLAILNALSVNRGGMSRVELSSVAEIGDGEPLTKALNELEQCGFIRKYQNVTTKNNGYLFQIIDPFTLFCHKFLLENRMNSWLNYIHSPAYYAWSGNAFETVCLLHVPQIKQYLGISGIETTEHSWKSAHTSPGAQIDLLIDRRDGVINLCEMKFSNEPFTIDAAYEKQLLNKAEVFSAETGTEKALHLTLITASGLKENTHTGSVQNLITSDDLFRTV